MPWYVEIPLTMVIAVAVVLAFQAIVGRVYMIPSESMEPTLHGCEGCVGDRIFVEKLSYAFSDPEPGDVVVFKGPDSWDNAHPSDYPGNPVVTGLRTLGSRIGLVPPDETDLVKRIIATGGQTVSCQEGDPAVMVDGEPIDQSYVAQVPAATTYSEGASMACGGNYFGPVTVPEGNVWVMGDNRTRSFDSRGHIGDELNGTVPESNIRGQVRWIIFPMNRIGVVHSVDL